MFTGIIEELGIVASVVRGSQSGKVVVSVSKKLSAEVKIGDSIAINGVCLTVTHIRRHFLEFDVSPETFKKSSFYDLKIGDKVNIERALPVAGRLGGHLVTGHVDGVGEIRQRVKFESGFELHISIPSEMLRYIVGKGSIALDGISLTVSDLRNALIVVTIIPHTAKSTTLGFKSIGDRINIEVDILSKYIERFLKGETASVGEDTLVKMGFLPMGWIDN
jgi:riboflavin synthase